MSLFRSRECWSATCGSNEGNFDRGSVCIANIDNIPDGLDKIMVGSPSGALYVFSPLVMGKSDDRSPSASNSVLLESQLALPILHLAAGKFVSSSDNVFLAVLHPRKLTVYSISFVAGSVAHGSHYNLAVIYEHNLERSAFTMVAGPFGRVVGRDFICVMSLDGTLSIFEQESYIFSRFLPGALLPGPLSYNIKTDSFIIASSASQIENYKYQALALSSSSKSSESGQKLVMDWSFNLGECALDLSVIVSKSGSSLIYVLGERHIFCLKDNGTLKFLKKLEFSPTCFHVYPHGDDDSVFYIIGSHTGMAMIYRDVALKWATQVPIVPVSITRIDLQELEGGVLILSEQGELSCVYLGTNPTAVSSFPNKCRPINLEETNKELEKLNRIINAAQKSGALLTNKPDAQLTISATVIDKELPSISKSEASTEAYHCNLQIYLKPIVPVQNVQLACYFERSFNVSKRNFYLPLLGDSTSLTVDISLCEGFLPSELTGSITAVYNNSLGVPVIVQTFVTLPFKVAVATCSPPKDADFKLTICLNKVPVKLDELFPDFVSSSDTGSSQVIGFQYYGGPTVTILMAKTSQRYRLQSDNFECMGLILSEVLHRLQKWFHSATTDDKLTCSYQNDIPLQEFYLIVSTHLQNRQRADVHVKRLSQLASQIRAIEKRLLLKFKDKAATPLSNLDNLLESTFKQMSTAATAMESHKSIIDRSLSCVIAASRLICLLLKLYTNMSDLEYSLLSKVMGSDINDEFEQGWEEIVTSGLETLLQTTFSKGAFEGTTLDVKLKMPENLEYFKKQLNGVIEFITRGNLIEEQSEQLQNELDNSTDDKKDYEGLLIGTQFGERVLNDNSLPDIAANEEVNPDSEITAVENHAVDEQVKQTPEMFVESVDNLPEIYTTTSPDYLEEF